MRGATMFIWQGKLPYNNVVVKRSEVEHLALELVLEYERTRDKISTVVWNDDP